MFQLGEGLQPTVFATLPQRLRQAVVMVTCASLVASSLSGCVTTREGRIGADDGSDACRAYVVALDSTGEYFGEDMLKGALAGAAAGALVGALASGGGNIGRAVVIGAASGAVLGGIGGYWQSKQNQGRDQAVLAVNADMSQEAQQMDRTSLAFKKLTECRRTEAAKVKKQYAAKAISREEAQQRLKVLAQQAQNDLKIMTDITANMGKRLNEYQVAANQIDSTIPAPVPGGTPAVVAAPTEQGASKKSSTNKKKQAAAAKPTGSQTAQSFNSLQVKYSTIVTDKDSYSSEQVGWDNGQALDYADTPPSTKSQNRKQG